MRQMNNENDVAELANSLNIVVGKMETTSYDCICTEAWMKPKKYYIRKIKVENYIVWLDTRLGGAACWKVEGHKEFDRDYRSNLIYRVLLQIKKDRGL